MYLQVPTFAIFLLIYRNLISDILSLGHAFFAFAVLVGFICCRCCRHALVPHEKDGDGSKKKKTKTPSGADKENQGEGQWGQGLAAAAGGGRQPPRKLLEFCERFMEFLIDLLCQLPTR